MDLDKDGEVREMKMNIISSYNQIKLMYHEVS